MKKRNIIKIFTIVITGLSLLTCSTFAAEKIIKMSTTTSTQASGLLNILLPELEKETGIKIKVIAKGTGAAIRDGMDGNVDVIFVHAKEREVKFIEDGFGTKRYPVMHNDFVIIGPASDPAGIKGNDDAIVSFEKIADSKNEFVSRGDDSGTHTKEQFLWEKTAIPCDKKTTTIAKDGKKKEIVSIQPTGEWYLSIGQGMGKTITLANEKQAYTLSDRGTYIKYKYGGENSIDLEILCEKDPMLHNSYGVIPVNPKKHPHVKYDFAEEFAKWLISPRAQNLIKDYKLIGKQLFYPDSL